MHDNVVLVLFNSMHHDYDPALPACLRGHDVFGGEGAVKSAGEHCLLSSETGSAPWWGPDSWHIGVAIYVLTEAATSQVKTKWGSL